ncbi:hypothetical protein [Roseisolibacter agri]|uniref:Uncharacterized protein n=1 Tax=Roseisolibacter agri TaxID=2014610 RepID=A0AA37QDD3_9BACT|nr:hypothetical protein [Roseisolibacter agri]GLC24618.1 hypothetical protein rosag_11310 [Roseisolibacter agri]
MEPRWPDVAPDFAPDGSLRDVYVFGTTEADWDAVLAHVRARYAPLRFTVDGEPAPVPARFADGYAVRERAAPCLTFHVGGVALACHFFDPGQIEFDLLPQEVDGPERLAAVTAFLRELAHVTARPAVLTAASQPDPVILRADPVTGAVVFMPPPDVPAG